MGHDHRGHRLDRDFVRIVEWKPEPEFQNPRFAPFFMSNLCKSALVIDVRSVALARGGPNLCRAPCTTNYCDGIRGSFALFVSRRSHDGMTDL